jgi:hypothetical protein
MLVPRGREGGYGKWIWGSGGEASVGATYEDKVRGLVQGEDEWKCTGGSVHVRHWERSSQDGRLPLS